jgi:hypothetical protein
MAGQGATLGALAQKNAHNKTCELVNPTKIRMQSTSPKTGHPQPPDPDQRDDDQFTRSAGRTYLNN